MKRTYEIQYHHTHRLAYPQFFSWGYANFWLCDRKSGNTLQE